MGEDMVKGNRRGIEDGSLMVVCRVEFEDADCLCWRRDGFGTEIGRLLGDWECFDGFYGTRWVGGAQGGVSVVYDFVVFVRNADGVDGSSLEKELETRLGGLNGSSLELSVGFSGESVVERIEGIFGCVDLKGRSVGERPVEWSEFNSRFCRCCGDI
jgi:hypothetical protein